MLKDQMSDEEEIQCFECRETFVYLTIKETTLSKVQEVLSLHSSNEGSMISPINKQPKHHKLCYDLVLNSDNKDEVPHAKQ